jgi:hypothetical protein
LFLRTDTGSGVVTKDTGLGPKEIILSSRTCFKGHEKIFKYETRFQVLGKEFGCIGIT